MKDRVVGLLNNFVFYDLIWYIREDKQESMYKPQGFLLSCNAVLLFSVLGYY